MTYLTNGRCRLNRDLRFERCKMAIVRYDVGGCCVFKRQRVRGGFPSSVSPYPEEGPIQSTRKGLHVGVSDALSKSTSDPFGQEHLVTNTKGGGHRKKSSLTISLDPWVKPCKNIGKIALIPLGKPKPGRFEPGTPTCCRICRVEKTRASISSFFRCLVNSFKAVQAALTTSESLSSKEISSARMIS
jgi:hypothetical protein